jgi:hypothetical protein
MDFLEQWNLPDQYSSWCKIKHLEAIRKNKQNIIEEETLFGQFNYFVQLFLPNEKLISGLAFGFVSVYKTTFDEKKSHYYTNRNDFEHMKENFYCLNNIQSTNIGLSVFDKYKKPVNKQNDYNSKNVRKETFENSSRNYDYVKSEKQDFENIYFLELQPFRESILYSSILVNDEDRKLDYNRVRIDYKCSIIVIYE